MMEKDSIFQVSIKHLPCVKHWEFKGKNMPEDSMGRWQDHWLYIESLGSNTTSDTSYLCDLGYILLQLPGLNFLISKMRKLDEMASEDLLALGL